MLLAFYLAFARTIIPKIIINQFIEVTLNQQLVPLGNNTPQRQGISTTKIIDNYSILSKIIGSQDSLSRSLIDAWSDVAVVHPARETLCTYTHCEDRYCRSRMAMRGPT